MTWPSCWRAARSHHDIVDGMGMIRKKLIEVDLPLDEINAESKREKSIRHGHPSTLHIWWARRPLAACRAVIFASMVDDPSSCPEEFPTEDVQRTERNRLHDIIRGMVKWENTDESKPKSRRIQNEARYEIARSVARSHGEAPPPDDPAEVLRYLRDRAPPIHDPFAGGGSIPLEAQRLGLRTIASDLNPMAVLINKALIELPPKFAGKPPINPGAANISEDAPWTGAAGLACDIRYYGKYMRDEALKRIGHLYPKAKLPSGGEATVIAWLWARTVPCPNPACGIAMPMVASFQLSKKKNNQHWTRPVIDQKNRTVSFVVQNHGKGVPKQGTVNRNGVTCIACGTVSPLSYVREQSRIGNMGEQMTAIVAEGDRKRLFLSSTDAHIYAALSAKCNTDFIPQQRIPTTTYKISASAYGIAYWHQLFTERQLAILAIFSDLLTDTKTRIVKDGTDEEYAGVISTYLALAIGKTTNSCSSYARWQNIGDKIAGVFARQAIPMLWDFAESNPFCESTQNWNAQIKWITEVLEALPGDINGGVSHQADAATTIHVSKDPVMVTDPPYYDNISYAELSDFFYVWLRPLLQDIYPGLFAGILVPKQEEMVAAPRFEKTDEYVNSRDRFEKLMGNALRSIRERCNQQFPSSIFYAYKQQEEKREGTSSTGWDTMLSALVSSGFQIVGSWPIRTEREARSNALSANTLASSIILVCRERSTDARVATRREFVNALRSELPQAVRNMQEGNIAPVDLAQAAIGPGMAVFTRYSKVLDVSGDTIPVRAALSLINQTLDDVLAEQEGHFDADSRWALAWFEQSGFAEDDFGVAETLSKAKNTSVAGMVEAGILESGVGKVRLLRPRELPQDWNPEKDKRLTVWEATHHLVRVLDQGENAAAELMAKMGPYAEATRELAYRLYHICEQKNRAQEAQDYNALVQSLPEISRLAREVATQQVYLPAEMKAYDDR